MSALKILIVEDEGLIAEHLKLSLEALGYNVVGIAAKHSTAMELLKTKKPDLALVDIILAGAKDGIALGADIREKYDMPFVFLTSHSDQATVKRATSVRPNGYLIKPYERADLYTAIETAIANYTSHGQAIENAETEDALSIVKNSLFIKDKEVYVKLNVNDILWLKAEGNYTHIQSKDGRNLVRGNLKNMMEKLPSTPFFRTHKSYAINVNCIEGINPQTVLINGTEVPITKELREELLNKLQTL